MSEVITSPLTSQKNTQRLSSQRLLLPWLTVFGATWIFFIASTSSQWLLNPEYHYGWAVPFLCLALCWERWHDRPAAAPSRNKFAVFAAGAALIAVVFGGLLIQEANPDWLFATWTVAFAIMGLLLLETYAAGGVTWLKRFTPAIFFLITALPWPFFLEHRVVQDLTRLVTAAATEVLLTCGIPALQHGNVIEVKTGLVGIDEACSGIRSLQAVVMISLFFGTKYRLGILRSAALLLGGAAVACLCNVGRSSALAAVVATRGMTALASWHDPLGVAVLLICFSVVWLGGTLLKWTAAREAPTPGERTMQAPPHFLSPAAAILFISLLPMTWLATQTWYWIHERGENSGAGWAPEWPRANPSFIQHEIPKYTFNLLLYDEGIEAGWDDQSGAHWEAAYFRWRPGLRAAQSLRDHVPQTCLPGAGMTFISTSDEISLTIHGIAFPIERYVADDQGKTLYIYRCITGDLSSAPGGKSVDWSRAIRLQRVFEGRRPRSDQRILELSATGFKSQDAADKALQVEMDSLVRT